ncbi:coilin-like [Asparagus officinalis]|nr:coilin-like [Asparagus officinalis]
METRQWNGTTSMKKGQNWSQEKMGGNWNGANGYKGQPAWKDKTMSKGNEDNGYRGQKWAREKTLGKWNDDSGYRGQKWAREKNMSKWNDDNGHRGQKWASERTGSKWNGPNGYKREKCTWDDTTIKWNNGYTEHANKKEKFVSKWSNANRCTEQCNVQTSNWSDANGEQSNKKALSEKGMNNSCLINFESLFPLTRIPQVGDVLAYRLIEMSSSWCPEVSSFRVGLVTSYNYISLSIILVPVPEHPIHSQANFSPYKEDGSLQIHYPSLVDVRLLKASDSEATTSDYSGREVNTQQAAHANNWELAVAKTKLDNSGREMSSQEHVNNWDLLAVNSNAKGSVVQPTDSGNANGSTWDQIKQVLNDKRAQLQNKKDGWDEWTPNKSTPNTSWSYEGLRRNAAGSTFTYQRGKNNNNKRPFRK